MPPARRVTPTHVLFGRITSAHSRRTSERARLAGTSSKSPVRLAVHRPRLGPKTDLELAAARTKGSQAAGFRTWSSDTQSTRLAPSKSTKTDKLLANRHLERLDKILVMPSEHHLISWGRETRALLLTGALSAENRADAPRKLGQAEMEVRRLRRFDACRACV